MKKKIFLVYREFFSNLIPQLQEQKQSKYPLIDLAELEKDFTCLICDLTCFGAKSMSDHIRTHEGDQLTCHLCGYKCAKFGYLVLHTRLHDKELVKVAQQPEKGV